MGLKPYCKDTYGDEIEAIDNTSYLAKELYTMVGKGAGHGHCNVNTSNSRPDLITFLLHLLSQQTGYEKKKKRTCHLSNLIVHILVMLFIINCSCYILLLLYIFFFMPRQKNDSV